MERRMEFYTTDEGKTVTHFLDSDGHWYAKEFSVNPSLPVLYYSNSDKPMFMYVSYCPKCQTHYLRYLANDDRWIELHIPAVPVVFAGETINAISCDVCQVTMIYKHNRPLRNLCDRCFKYSLGVECDTCEFRKVCVHALDALNSESEPESESESESEPFLFTPVDTDLP